jgi:hypothetical protein
MSDETNDMPMPDKGNVVAALAVSAETREAAQQQEIDEAARWALHVLGPYLQFTDVAVRNPLSQVYFRAGLLACREYMARFVEQSGQPEIAASIRANWWPDLGGDPGAPRLFDFAEIAEEVIDGENVGYRSKPVSASQEALPRAYQFLLSKASP